MSTTFVESITNKNRTKAAKALGGKAVTQPNVKPSTAVKLDGANAAPKKKVVKKTPTASEKPKKVVKKATVPKAGSKAAPKKAAPKKASSDAESRTLTLSSVRNIATIGGIPTMTKTAAIVLREFLHKDVLACITQIGSLQARKCGRYTINPEDVSVPLNALGMSIDMSETVSRNARKKKEQEEKKKQKEGK